MTCYLFKQFQSNGQSKPKQQQKGKVTKNGITNGAQLSNSHLSISEHVSNKDASAFTNQYNPCELNFIVSAKIKIQFLDS